MPLLEVKDLKTYFNTRRGVIKAVNGVSYSVEAGRTLGIVGESGSGKSVSAMSILGLVDSNGWIEGGEILFEGTDMTKLSRNEMYKMRGNAISVIFQEPMTSLNPVFTIERQVSEPFIIHRGMSKAEAAKKAVEMLADVKIPNPEAVAKQYPHQLSGGMRQRVMIAMNNLKKEKGTAILFITHDLGVINQMADDVAVMYCGQVVEMTPARTIFDQTISPYLHPYTEGLLHSIPRLDTEAHTRLEVIPGSVPHPADLPVGCKFAPRCKYATDRCRTEEPQLVQVSPTQQVRCFYPGKEERK